MRHILLAIPLLATAAQLSAQHVPGTAPGTAAPSGSAASLDTGVAVLAPDAEDRWVPFQLTGGNQIRFTMTLDGRPLSAILDTGVSYSVIARGSAAFDASRTTPTGSGSAAAIGGSVTMGWMKTGTMTVGGLTRTGGGVGVADLPATATGGGSPVDLLVGRDLLGEQALDIDYAAHRFRLIRSSMKAS
jgi:hypothetical protein